MNRYEGRQLRTYNRMASVTLVAYKMLLAEKEVIEALLESNAYEYERLIDDIKQRNQIMIDDTLYEIRPKENK